MREIIDHKTGAKRWEEVPPELEEGEKEVIWINQDESLFYVNDDAGGTWLEADKNYIEIKGKQVHLTPHTVLLPSSFHSP